MSSLGVYQNKLGGKASIYMMEIRSWYLALRLKQCRRHSLGLIQPHPHINGLLLILAD